MHFIYTLVLLLTVYCAFGNGQTMTLSCDSTGLNSCTSSTTPLTLVSTSVSVSNCVFLNCPSVILNYCSVSFTNVSFIGSNGAYGLGGALSITVDNTVSISMTGVTFSSNYVGNAIGGSGGALYISGKPNGPIILNNITLTNNTSGNGGGIMFDTTGDVIINGLYAKGNSAYNQGGAIYFYGCSRVFINNATFSSNSVTGIGGGDVCVMNSPLFISNYVTSGSTALTGGSLYSKGANATIDNFVFLGSIADTATAAWIEGGNITVTNVQLLNGRTSNGGAAGMYFAHDKSVVINNALVSNCSCLNMGCGFYFYDAKVFASNLTFYNSVGTDGADIGASTANLNITNMTSTGAFAATGGSSFYLFSSTLNLNVATFNNGTNGQGVFRIYQNSIAQVSNANFYNCSGIGGVIANMFNVIAGTSFTNIYAANCFGTTTGAFSLTNCQNGVTFTNIVMTNCSSGRTGGDFNLQQSKIFLSNYVSVGAKSTNGSAIYANNAGSIYATGVSISGATASKGGGAIFLGGSTSVLDLKSSYIGFNNATHGAIFIRSFANISLADVTLEYNSASSLAYNSPGGGLFLDSAVGNLTNVVMRTNSNYDLVLLTGNIACTNCILCSLLNTMGSLALNNPSYLCGPLSTTTTATPTTSITTTTINYDATTTTTTTSNSATSSATSTATNTVTNTATNSVTLGGTGTTTPTVTGSTDSSTPTSTDTGSTNSATIITTANNGMSTSTNFNPNSSGTSSPALDNNTVAILIASVVSFLVICVLCVLFIWFRKSMRKTVVVQQAPLPPSTLQPQSANTPPALAPSSPNPALPVSEQTQLLVAEDLP